MGWISSAGNGGGGCQLPQRPPDVVAGKEKADWLADGGGGSLVSHPLCLTCEEGGRKGEREGEGKRERKKKRLLGY